MPDIKILPEILSNKIAAGEVVERPASVVKELLENALDAGGTRIMIEVKAGGKSLLRISDNGSGMNHDNALLAVERYATSKIQNEADLFAIRTLGFRGEALPSIAAVSRFTLISRDTDSAAATQIHIEGGKIIRVSEVGAPVGTLVSVKDLFFNVPARRKFLKSVTTESGHIGDTIARMAVAWPGVQFHFLHNQKTVRRWPAVTEPAERVRAVSGLGLHDPLWGLEQSAHGITLRGWIGSPAAARSTSRAVLLYVNGRNVYDRAVLHAIFEGYSGRLVKGQFPVAVLHIEVPFDQVDVNVHPSKNEIRFDQPRKVHDLIAAAIRETLRENERSRWVAQAPPPQATPLAETVPRYQDFKHNPASERPAPLTGIPFAAEIKQAPETAQQERLWPKRRFGDLRPVGQLHATYLLCEGDDGLVIIDQHAAHERIIYEQLKKGSASSGSGSQALLLPEVLELGFRESEILEHLIPELARLGLEIAPFGQNSFVVKSIPPLLGNRDIKAVIVEIAEKTAETGIGSGLDRALDESLMLLACHGAVRAGESLSAQQIEGLLAQLDACENPSHCPHGRPTFLTWSTAALEKAFKRTL